MAGTSSRGPRRINPIRLNIEEGRTTRVATDAAVATDEIIASDQSLRTDHPPVIPKIDRRAAPIMCSPPSSLHRLRLVVTTASSAERVSVCSFVRAARCSHPPSDRPLTHRGPQVTRPWRRESRSSLRRGGQALGTLRISVPKYQEPSDYYTVIIASFPARSAHECTGAHTGGHSKFW